MDQTEQLLNQFKMINMLSEQQSSYKQYSTQWNILERKLIEEECKLYNDIVELELQETQYLFEKLQILPMLGLHLYKCMYTENYQIINDLLSQNAKNFITLMWTYWQQIKQNE